MKIFEFANSVDPDEAAHNELLPPALHCLTLSFKLNSQYDTASTKHFYLQILQT